MIEIGLNKKRCKYVKIVAGVTYVLVSPMVFHDKGYLLLQKEMPIVFYL